MRPLVLGEPGLAGVLDHREAVFAGDGVDGVHVARHAVDVDREEGAGAVGDAAGDRGGVEGERGGIGVREDRQGLLEENGVVSGDEGIGRDDDLVTRVHVHDVEGDEQGGGAAGGGEAALGAEELRISQFELGDMFAGAAEPTAAAQDVEHGGFPGLAPDGPTGPATRVHGAPPRRAGWVVSAASTRGACWLPSQARVAEAAAVWWMNPRRVRGWFMV
ncbi:MAG: hypothetical protein M5U12_31350 [Verrucomicrobia bacterium]|nr:hypothetical protein [Verrucomicrobiota bacterium]